MPCRDGGPSAEQIREEYAIPCMLCAFATLAEKNGTLQEMLDKIDWNEAGVMRVEFVAWWERHKRDDRRRQAEEMSKTRKRKLRQDALDKLSPAERAALELD